MIQTYNEYHLGDNLVHLNFLRRLSYMVKDEIVHYCNPQLHSQLQPLVEDTSVVLRALDRDPHAINAWIGTNNYYYNHPLRHDWVQFHLDWFNNLSAQLGVLNPIASRKDLLFEYPRLNAYGMPHYDYLVCNSPPLSNQLPDFNPVFFENLVRNLLNEGKTVITTFPTGMCESTLDHHLDVTGIGNLSNTCDHHIGVATGPMWTTFNIFNQDAVSSRTWYCGHQTLNLTDNTVTLHRIS